MAQTEEQRAKDRYRYKTDPEYRAKKNARSRELHARRKENPEYKAKRAAQNKAWYERECAENNLRARRKAYQDDMSIKGLRQEWVRKYKAKPGVKERDRELSAGRFRTLNGRVLRLLSGCRQRAKRAGIDYALVPEEIAALMAPLVCARTGAKLTLDAVPGGSTRNNLTPSIDQITPGGGYTPDNVQITSTRYNIAKSNLTDAEFLELCKAVVTCAGYTISKDK